MTRQLSNVAFQLPESWIMHCEQPSWSSAWSCHDDPPQLNTQSPSPASHATGGVVAEMQDGNFLIRDTHFSVRRTNGGFFTFIKDAIKYLISWCNSSIQTNKNLRVLTTNSECIVLNSVDIYLCFYGLIKFAQYHPPISILRRLDNTCWSILFQTRTFFSWDWSINGWENDLSASITCPQDTGHHQLVCVLVTAVCWSRGRGDWHMMSDCLMPCLCLGPQLVFQKGPSEGS